MTRWLFNLMTLLSLALCVAVTALWVRSDFVRDQLRTGSVQINTDAGFVGCTVCESGATELTEWTAGTDSDYFPTGAVPDPSHLQRLESLERIYWTVQSVQDYPLLRVQKGRWAIVEGFTRDEPDPPDVSYIVSPYVAYRVPYWPAAVLTGVLPAASAMTAGVRRRRSRSRTGRGLCPRCGFDLRATPGRCPECGTPAAVSTTS